jgi:hypothetical protein
MKSKVDVFSSVKRKLRRHCEAEITIPASIRLGSKKMNVEYSFRIRNFFTATITYRHFTVSPPFYAVRLKNKQSLEYALAHLDTTSKRDQNNPTSILNSVQN